VAPSLSASLKSDLVAHSWLPIQNGNEAVTKPCPVELPTSSPECSVQSPTDVRLAKNKRRADSHLEHTPGRLCPSTSYATSHLSHLHINTDTGLLTPISCRKYRPDSTPRTRINFAAQDQGFPWCVSPEPDYWFPAQPTSQEEEDESWRQRAYLRCNMRTTASPTYVNYSDRSHMAASEAQIRDLREQAACMRAGARRRKREAQERRECKARRRAEQRYEAEIDTRLEMARKEARRQSDAARKERARKGGIFTTMRSGRSPRIRRRIDDRPKRSRSKYFTIAMDHTTLLTC
jgi:hypothetical protein